MRHVGYIECQRRARRDARHVSIHRLAVRTAPWVPLAVVLLWRAW